MNTKPLPDYKDPIRYILSDEEFEEQNVKSVENWGGYEIIKLVAEQIIKIVKENQPISSENIYKKLYVYSDLHEEMVPMYKKALVDTCLKLLERDHLEYIHTWDYAATIDNQNCWVLNKLWLKINEEPIKAQL